MDATKIFVTSKLGVAMLSVAALLGINAMNDAASTTNTMAWAWPWSSRSHLKAVCLELWGHFCLALLCVNVAYDLFIFAPLLWIFVRPLSKTVFHRLMTALINWTTYIVIGPPFAWCGMRAYVNDMPYFQDIVKSKNCLLLSNHGSRIDWLVGMYVGLIGRTIRVGFVCESLVKFLPFIGWYRNWVCEDIFVSRSFDKDEKNIRRKIKEFCATATKMLFFLAPEGMIVDHTEIGRLYTENCRAFCRDQGYKEFDYVLTPRYKGITVLSEHISIESTGSTAGEVVSVTMAFMRDGKLLDERLDSPDRVIPDLYTAFAGVGGSPVTVHIYIRKMPHFTSAEPSAVKKMMMDDYAFKDELLRHYHEKGCFPGIGGKPPVETEFVVPHLRVNLQILMHNLVIMGSFYMISHFYLIFKIGFAIFCLITASNTMGKMMYGHTMESIPFETGIKPVMQWLYMRKLKKNESDGSLGGGTKKAN